MVSIFHRLPKEIQNYGVTFLQTIQSLHDKDKFWNKKGLTDDGKRFASTFKNAILNNLHKN